MKKLIIGLISFISALIIGIIFLYFYDYKLELFTIELKDYSLENDYFEIVMTKKSNILFNHSFSCKASNGENEITAKSENNKCILKIPVNDNYEVSLYNSYNKTKNYNLENYLENDAEFKFEDELVYLVVGEEYKIKYNDKHIIKIDTNYEFISDNDQVIKIENGIVKALTPGKAHITLDGTESKLKIIVTDLITLKSVKYEGREHVPCHRYTEEENALLDELLKQRVEEAGYKTRAGAVAAARFLTLEFPYQIPYFYENGRLGEDGAHVVDGEGRYYHQGLYLSDSKMENISPTFSGPAIWGCDLRNWEDEPYFGYYIGKLMPNGLDCSGFVAWTLVNGGFDPGDIGAGENEGIYQMTDLGKFTPLDMDVINSGVIKVGDLFNYWGHIAIIIGYDGEHYYVAESLPNFDGVDVRIYTKEEAVNMFRFVVLMDDFYKEDGNYTEYWD